MVPKIPIEFLKPLHYNENINRSQNLNQAEKHNYAKIETKIIYDHIFAVNLCFMFCFDNHQMDQHIQQGYLCYYESDQFPYNQLYIKFNGVYIDWLCIAVNGEKVCFQRNSCDSIGAGKLCI